MEARERVSKIKCTQKDWECGIVSILVVNLFKYHNSYIILLQYCYILIG